MEDEIGSEHEDEDEFEDEEHMDYVIDNGGNKDQDVADFVADEEDQDDIVALHEEEDENGLPYVTKRKQMVLNKRYYDKILEMKKNFGLENYVKDQINSMNYNFAQMKESVNIHFCNEEMFGKLNIISSTGFMKVERRKDDEFVISRLPSLLNKYFPIDVCKTVLLYAAMEM